MANVSEELARLAKLRDEGVLSEEEFQQQKTEVLSSKGGGPAASGPIPEKKRGALAKGGIGCLVVVVILFIVGALASGGDDTGAESPSSGDTSSGAETATMQPALAVTAKALAGAYGDNEAAAQKQYGDRPLLVTGTVSSIDLDMFDDPVVQLKGTEMFTDVHVNLADADKPGAADLSKGQSITVRCAAVSEIMGSPILKECAFQ